MTARLLIAALVPVFVSLGCGDEIVRYVDPPIDDDGRQQYVPVGDPALELGHYEEQLYEPLLADDTLPVFHGTQGGTWSHPALRLQGIDIRPLVICTLTLDEGGVLGRAESRLRFVPSGDGWIEVQAYPVPVRPTQDGQPIALETVYGKPATLDCSVEDDEARAASASVHVVLGEQ